MVVLRPLKMVINTNGLPLATSYPVPNFPHDPSRGSHTIPISEVVYIDSSDFRVVDDDVSSKLYAIIIYLLAYIVISFSVGLLWFSTWKDRWPEICLQVLFAHQRH